MLILNLMMQGAQMTSDHVHRNLPVIYIYCARDLVIARFSLLFFWGGGGNLLIVQIIAVLEIEAV